MNGNSRISRFIITGITLMGLMFILNPSAKAQQGGDLRTSYPGIHQAPKVETVAGGPGFISLSSMAFRTYHPNYTFNYYGQMLYNPGAETASYEGAIAIPNGATVTRFVAYYVDNSLNNLSATLYRGPYNDFLAGTMAAVTSAEADLGYHYAEDTSINYPVIDQQSASYYVEVTLPATIDVKFLAVRVDYSYPQMLPLVKK